MRGREKNIGNGNWLKQFIVGALLAVGVLTVHTMDADALQKGPEVKIHFKQEFTIKNKNSKTIPITGSISTYNVSSGDTAYSHVLDDKYVNAFELVPTSNALGNRNVSFQIPSLNYQKSENISVENIVSMNTVDYELTPDVDWASTADSSLVEYLQPSKTIQSDSEGIKLQAATLRNSLPVEQRNKPYYITKAIYNYVVQNMHYTYNLNYTNKGADWALTSKIGNCEDYASLMIALLRASDIPARPVSGFRLTNSQVTSTKEINILSKANYAAHMWVEAYFKGYGWVAFEPTYISSTKQTIKYNGKSVVVYKPIDQEFTGGFAKLQEYYVIDDVNNEGAYTNFTTNGTLTKVLTTITGTTYNDFAALDTDNRKSIKLGTIKYSSSPDTVTAEYVLKNKKKEAANDLTWSTSDETIATIDSAGLLTFTGKQGTVTITANGPHLTASKTLKVRATIKYKNPLAFAVEGQQIDVTVKYPDKKTITPNTTWTSSDESIATVTPTGYITYTGKIGKVYFTGTTDYGDIIKTKTVSVRGTLKSDQTLTYSATPVQLKPYVVYGKVQVTTEPSAWVYTSSNPSVATVDENGLVTFTGNKGRVTIQISGKGLTLNKSVTVK